MTKQRMCFFADDGNDVADAGDGSDDIYGSDDHDSEDAAAVGGRSTMTKTASAVILNVCCC